MARPPVPRFVKPIQWATFDHAGESVVIRENEIFDADDPIVRARPELFKALEASRQRPVVEQATAAPGEIRA